MRPADPATASAGTVSATARHEDLIDRFSARNYAPLPVVIARGRRAWAVLASREVLGVFSPGDHGSTFGGNPLACAVARTALRIAPPLVIEPNDLDWAYERIARVLH